MIKSSQLTPKQERGERRRSQIIEAATKLFLEKGFARTSLDEVILTAGGSRRDIYTWFGNKEALFGAVVSEVSEEILKNIDAMKLADAKPREALIQFGKRFVEIIISPHAIALHRVVAAESGAYPELGKSFFAAAPGKSYNQLANDLERWRDEGLLDVGNAPLAARFLLEAMKGDLLMRAMFLNQQPSSAEIDETVTAAVDAALFGMASIVAR